jgi:hypothetical protein
MTTHVAMIDGSFEHLRLGKLPPKDDPRTLMLVDYIDVEALPPIPAAMDWTGKVPTWPMYGNDQLRDCTCAAAGHMIQAWTFNAGHPKTPTTAAVEKIYWETGSPPAPTGYPEGPTDTGRYELDVLNYWRKTGVGRDKATAYAAIHPANVQLVKAAIFIFGGVYTGIELPVTAQRQSVWDYVGGSGSEPGSWGGHAVPYHAYDAAGVKLVTWGGLMGATWAFHQHYTDEVYAVIDLDWLKTRTSSGMTPSGFNETQLLADLQQIAR